MTVSVRLGRLQRRPADLPRTLSDEQLAHLTSEGDAVAFDMLAARHRPALVRQCAELVGEGDAEEAAQETLIRAYLALARRERIHSVGPWLRTIAHNAALNLLRARRMRPIAGEGERQQPEPGTDTFELREQLRLLVRALASLPERQREAIVMREIEGRSYAEIQARLGASNGAVRQLIYRARTGLRDQLRQIAPSSPSSV